MITTRKISEITTNTFFFVPDYQRGYKWTTLQVEQLLNDIIQFEKTSTNNLNQSYCLQPIVLKKMRLDDLRLKKVTGVRFNDENIIYELIDGQQRLTTLFLILSFLNNRFKPEFATEKFQLFYETRERSYSFIEKLGEKGICEELEEESNENIDFHHIYQSLKFITNYFIGTEEKRDVNLFESTLLFRTKFIWYEVDEDENSTAKEIFKRLNSGKVELTNAELVKALFLGKFDNGYTSDSERMQMSIEWEWIENKLNQDEFWYFLTDDKSEKNNRISFILDQFSRNQNIDHLNKEDKRFTFLVFNELFQDKGKVRYTWEELKRQFRIIHNWYSDYELFHYIGFLLSTYVGETLDRMFLLYNEAGESIEIFKELLLTEIDEQVNQNDLNELNYNHHYYQIKKVLLWFNISMMLKDKNRNQRFNFYKFKDLKFDVEHIKSLDSEITKSDKSKKEFLTAFFNYYVHNKELVDNQMDEDTGTMKLDLLARIDGYLKDSRTDDFNEILTQIKEEFEIEDTEFESEEDHSIGNLCLLDQGTNRGYKNAIFPIKRQTIIDNDLQGVYILPMTKSAFLKQFNGRTKNLLVWTTGDSEAYKQVIINQLN